MSRGVGLDEAVAALPSRANMCLLPRIVLKGSDSASVWHSPLFFSHLSSSLPVVAFSDVVVIHVGSDAASRTHSVGASLRIITAQSRRWSHNGNTGANGVSLSHQGFFPGYHSTCPQMSLGLPTVDLAAPPDMQLEGIKAFPAEYAPFHCFLYVCRCNRLHEFLQIYSVRSLALPRSVVSIAPVCA